MFRPLLVAVACLAVACRPDPPPRTEPYNPRISPGELIIEYHSGKTRDGKRIVTTLLPKTYDVVPGGIHYHVVVHRPPATPFPPAIVFLCTPPPDNSRFLEVTGVVRGVERDEVDRGSGIRFTIVVDVAGLVVR